MHKDLWHSFSRQVWRRFREASMVSFTTTTRAWRESMCARGEFVGQCHILAVEEQALCQGLRSLHWLALLRRSAETAMLCRALACQRRRQHQQTTPLEEVVADERAYHARCTGRVRYHFVRVDRTATMALTFRVSRRRFFSCSRSACPWHLRHRRRRQCRLKCRT